MTAICKTILIHGTNLQNLLDYGADQDKTSVIKNNLEDALTYASNPLKTIADLEDGHKELLVSGVLCQPETAVLDFGITRECYLASHGEERYSTFDYFDKRIGESRLVQKEPVTAIHLIQSFSETNLNPQTVHQIGIDLCERLGVQAVVDTHLNKEHLHNHIIINSYMPDGISKFCMTAEKRMEIRELSDEIQHSYGIELTLDNPRVQLMQSLGKGTYREWDAKRQHISWKEEMKNDMAAARSVSDSKEDFITIMLDYGYEISRQEKNSITWWNKSHTRKVRDKTLGADYELGILFPHEVPSMEIVIGREPQKASVPPKTISIARYDWNGRRRSDLELFIRKAIALIRHIGNRYQTKNNSTYSSSRKLEMMEQALEMIRDKGYSQRSDVETARDKVGAELNHTKSELRKMEGQKVFFDTVMPLLSSYKATKHMVDSIKYWPDGKMPDLMLNNYSSTDIQKSKASLCPMSSIQKRDLYLILQAHPEYTLYGEGFAEVSAMDAEQVFAFLKGKTTEKPNCLRDSVDATMEQVYQKRNEYLKQKFDKPIKPYQMKEVSALLSAHGITMDISNLTQFDVINIRNCYGVNPSDTPSHNPASPRIDEMSADRLQSFMDAKGISSSIPIAGMCKADYDKMYGYVISQGQIPDCVKALTESLQQPTAEAFLESIQVDGITEKKQLLLLQLRNQMNELLQLGIDPFHLEPLELEIKYFRNSYEELNAKRLDLSDEYKSLLRLEQQLTYAESPSFIFGSLFNEKVHEKPEVLEKDTKDEKEYNAPKQSQKPKINIEPDL